MRSLSALAALSLAVACVPTVESVAVAQAGQVRVAAVCGRPAAISHRGLGAGAPESTLRGFRGVSRLGVNILESDVRFTRDQVPVIMHDATVDRTTSGTGRVADLTYRQVSRLDAGEATRVPRLRGLVALADRRGARLLAELKPRRTTMPQVRAVVRIVRARGMGPSTTIHSRYPANLRRVNRLAPQIRTMLVLGPRDGFRVRPRTVEVVGANQNSVTRSRVRRWHRTGVRVYAWTVNRRAAWRRLAAAGVDGIVTDRPGPYLRWARRGCR
jgi:glycerophosphoryl diester phosphodiesterase